MSHAADPNDAARLLLTVFEQIKGSSSHHEDEAEAQRLARLPLSALTIAARMRAIAQRNGAAWRPSRLRYFANPIADLLKEQPRQQPEATPSPAAEPPPLSEAEHVESLAALQALETPGQRRRVELVSALEPRATFPELMRLLHDRMNDDEFSRRLGLARQRRQGGIVSEAKAAAS